MKEFAVYILFSKKYQKTYTGFTSSLVKRFYSHNKFSTKGFTVKYRPWEVIYVEFYSTKQEAMQREKFLKSGVGRKWVKETILINYLDK